MNHLSKIKVFGFHMKNGGLIKDMNIKKVLAGSLAAITAGATLAFGAFGAGLGDYVTTTDSTLSSPMIVVGNSVPGSDVIGAADIAAAVAGYATTTTTTRTTTTTATQRCGPHCPRITPATRNSPRPSIAPFNDG